MQLFSIFETKKGPVPEKYESLWNTKVPFKSDVFTNKLIKDNVGSCELSYQSNSKSRMTCTISRSWLSFFVKDPNRKTLGGQISQRILSQDEKKRTKCLKNTKSQRVDIFSSALPLNTKK